MKRISIILISLLTIISCVKENERVTETDLHEVVFHAGWDDETKTVLQEDGNSIWWSPGDEISLFVRNQMGGGYKFTATNTEPTATVDFVGEIPGGSEKYVAIYPYNIDNELHGDDICFSIPSEQAVEVGTFSKNALVSVAVASDNNLHFINLCSGIKFSVAHDNISSVIIKSRNWRGIAGYVGYVTISAMGEPAMAPNGSSSSIVVTCADGACFKPGSYYYVSVLPGTFDSGVEIEYLTTDGLVGKFISDNSISFQRATVKRLYEKDKELTFYPYHERQANLYGYAILPNDVDKTTIKKVSFITDSNKTTDTQIYTDSFYPIYFEQDGTEVIFYTSANIYCLRDANRLFSGWTALKEVDLSGIETADVTGMAGMFEGCVSLSSINFGHFHTDNVSSMAGMFSDCWSLESLDLHEFQTSKVTSMSKMFAGCSSLKTLDLSSFDTSNVEDMSNMFGPGFMGNTYTWRDGRTGCSSLESLDLHTFNTSKVKNMNEMFRNCYNLRSVNMRGCDTPAVESLGSMFKECASLESVDLTSFDTRNVTWMGHMFSNCTSLVTLDLSNFKTPNVTSMQNMFDGCESLQILDIRNFDSLNLNDAMQFLAGAHSLKRLDMGSFDLSGVGNLETPFNGVAKRSKSIAIKCIDATKQTLERLSNDYFILDYVTWIGLSEEFPALPADEKDPNLYYSTDYSMNRHVKVYQTASKGSGIDIVIMGDAYSDRLIADGTYERDMIEAIDAIFSVEPMKSYQDLFNVYIVFAVSENEVYDGSTIFKVQPTEDIVIGDILMSNVYTKLAVHNKPFSDVATIVIGHDTNAFVGVSGVTSIAYTYNLDQYCDYGGGAEWNVAYVGRWDDANYAYTTVHEFGHLFSKLADEYVTKDEMIGESYEYEIQNLENLMLHCGVYKNIDFTNDLDTIKWSKFLKDSRYSNENLGAYQGGLLYERGVWRPSEDSIMRNAWTSFNAPSRESIYNRIHKLAYGDCWQYDYETFVQQDLKNIPSTASTAIVKSVPYPAGVNKKPLFKMEESTTPDGKKMVTVIME